MWKSFLEVVRFILTKFDPVSSHGDPVRAKSYPFLTHLGWLAGLAGRLGWLAWLAWLGWLVSNLPGEPADGSWGNPPGPGTVRHL